MPRCKNCTEKFEPKHFNQKYCFKSECVSVWVSTAKDKNWKVKKKKWKTELKTTKDYMKEAQQIFNKYIRMRDSCMPCISCNTALINEDKFDAGHYYSSGGHKSITFDERNVHGQCVHCNRYLSGNLINYQLGLVRRIGGEGVLDLNYLAHIERKYTIEELENIIITYKNKCKQLMNR